MSATLLVQRVGPLATIQDLGRFGVLSHGVSASGPMDRSGFVMAGEELGAAAPGAIEITTAGIDLRIESGRCRIGLAGGHFEVTRNGKRQPWPTMLKLKSGDALSITPGKAGNYGYLRFDQQIDVPAMLGSIATNSRVGLGGHEGRALKVGDHIGLIDGLVEKPASGAAISDVGPIRIFWGLHADIFAPAVRDDFINSEFAITTQMDRMGVRLKDDGKVFAASQNLNLVSDTVVAGDIQVLGDGTPIVLMRDHQPTGGYPRIATIISADLDRFAQMRPGTRIAFQSVTVEHAHKLWRSLSL